MAAVYVFLNKSIVTDSLFEEAATRTGKERFNGETIFVKDGRPHFILQDLEKLPEGAEEYVLEVTCLDNHSMLQCRRELGIYRHKSATAEVEIGMGTKEHYHIKARGKTVDDVRELVRLFKAGKIRPEESFDGEQQGKSRAELEAEVQDLQRKLEIAETLGKKLVGDVSDAECKSNATQRRLDYIGRVAMELYPPGNRTFHWPYCSKVKVVNKLNRAFDPCIPVESL